MNTYILLCGILFIISVTSTRDSTNEDKKPGYFQLAQYLMGSTNDISLEKQKGNANIQEILSYILFNLQGPEYDEKTQDITELEKNIKKNLDFLRQELDTEGIDIVKTEMLTQVIGIFEDLLTMIELMKEIPEGEKILGINPNFKSEKEKAMKRMCKDYIPINNKVINRFGEYEYDSKFIKYMKQEACAGIDTFPSKDEIAQLNKFGDDLMDAGNYTVACYYIQYAKNKTYNILYFSDKVDQIMGLKSTEDDPMKAINARSLDRMIGYDTTILETYYKYFLTGNLLKIADVENKIKELTVPRNKSFVVYSLKVTYPDIPYLDAYANGESPEYQKLKNDLMKQMNTIIEKEISSNDTGLIFGGIGYTYTTVVKYFRVHEIRMEDPYAFLKEVYHHI